MDKLRLTMTVDEGRVADLLCCGMEGGIGHWAQIVDYIKPPVVWTNGSWAHVYPHIHYPLSEGGAVILRDSELLIDDAVSEVGELLEPDWNLDRAAIQRGLDLLPIKSPRHLALWLSESEDAESGDVFIQLCLFGEIVYG